jgi:serine protease Do
LDNTPPFVAFLLAKITANPTTNQIFNCFSSKATFEMMKQIFSLVIAGIIGGFVAIGGMYYLQQDNNTFANGSAKQVRNINIDPDELNAPSGFTEADGYIVTNNHVVEFADKIEVTLYDNRKFAATIVGTDARADLAVLKIEGATNLPTLLLADSDRAKIGQWVLAVGNPLNLNSTVTAGIISAKGRDIDIIKGRDAIEAFIQTDAAVNPGNSGGALVDDEGRLLGINTAISTRTGYFQGYSFAIPVNIMTKIVDDIIEYGSFKRAYLGIGIFELDNEYAQENQLNIARGVVIDTVEDGGSAQFAGLLPKDVILEVEGRAIKTVVELQELVSRARVGEVITLTIHRDGENMEVPVRLKEG